LSATSGVLAEHAAWAVVAAVTRKNHQTYLRQSGIQK
jgi:hypothetical protein